MDAGLAVIRAPFSVAIYGHGAALMITHAGGRMFLPSMWHTYWPNFFRQYPMWFNKDYHARMIYDLVNDPDYFRWKQAGAAVDPHNVYTDYDLYNKWGGKFGAAGKRGADALKIYRMAANKAMWAKVDPAIKNDPQASAMMMKNIAKLNNHATGVANIGHGPLTTGAQTLLFAAKLQASRWARLFGDPAKTIYTGFDWRNASAADKAIAVQRVKHAAQFAGFYFSALLANQALLTATGSNQKVNLTDPKKSDWLKFKAKGYDISLEGALLAPVRFLGNIIFGDMLATRTKQQQREDTRFNSAAKAAGNYVRGQLNPAVAILTDSRSFQADYSGRPMPFSTEHPAACRPDRNTPGPNTFWRTVQSHWPERRRTVYGALGDQGMSAFYGQHASSKPLPRSRLPNPRAHT